MQSVVGVKDATFTDKNGKTVVGSRIYVSSPIPAPGIGVQVNDYYVKDVLFSTLHLGDIITCIFQPGYGGKQVCTGVLYAEDIKLQKGGT